MQEGIDLHFYNPSAPIVPIRIGTTTAQDLIVALGRPPQVWYKDDTRMTIHSTHKEYQEDTNDCELFCDRTWTRHAKLG